MVLGRSGHKTVRGRTFFYVLYHFFVYNVIMDTKDVRDAIWLTKRKNVL